MTVKEKLEIVDELLVEYMKPHSSWKYMEQIQKLLQEIGYPSQTKKADNCNCRLKKYKYKYKEFIRRLYHVYNI